MRQRSMRRDNRRPDLRGPFQQRRRQERELEARNSDGVRGRRSIDPIECVEGHQQHRGESGHSEEAIEAKQWPFIEETEQHKRRLGHSSDSTRRHRDKRRHLEAVMRLRSSDR